MVPMYQGTIIATINLARRVRVEDFNAHETKTGTDEKGEPEYEIGIARCEMPAQRAIRNKPPAISCLSGNSPPASCPDPSARSRDGTARPRRETYGAADPCSRACAR